VQVFRHDQVRYCASLTCSIQSTTLPSNASAIAMCVIAVVGAAPCQCFSPGANQTTSPGWICSTGPPSRCARPLPAATINVCPSGCVCQAVRAPGSNVTLAPLTRAGSGALNSGSMRTAPVNHSAGPLPDGWVPFLRGGVVLDRQPVGCTLRRLGPKIQADLGIHKNFVIALLQFVAPAPILRMIFGATGEIGLAVARHWGLLIFLVFKAVARRRKSLFA